MIRRTTIELDEDLVSAASVALKQSTIRSTVEVALRLAVATVQKADREQRQAQVDAMKRLSKLIDSDVLMSGEAWR
jgi:Arc/MetJ family transcription regulator